MEFKAVHWVGISLALVIIGIAFLFFGTAMFFFIIGIGILIGVFPFVFSTIRSTVVANQKEEMFLEFARNLVESVKTGTPISKSIVNVKDRPYGVLSENITKLANQIQLGIPLNKAIQTFSKDVRNKTIARALTLIGQAERAGGDIGVILESVANAVSTSDKLKKERKATIQTLVVQGYIIFLVFIIIILVMQFKILPMISGIAEVGGGFGLAGGGAPIDQAEISNAFLYLLLIQGLFSGLTIGKLAEGNIKAGIKHSFALVVMSFLIAAGANAFFGGAV
jgi:pilus assembly protein TadC